MDSDQFGRLIYLMLLATVVGGSFLVANRRDMGRIAQQLAVWGLIFAGAAAAYGLWSDIRGSDPRIAVVSETGQIEVPRGRDGHYYLTLKINGEAVEFMVDTGASEVVLSQQDAKRVGIDTASMAYIGTAQTANGPVRTAKVRLQDVKVGEFDEGQMVAWVNDGEMDMSLLGMSYLDQFSRMEFTGNVLVLTR